MHGASFLEFLRVGCSPLRGQMIANRIPAPGHAFLPQAVSDDLYDLIGKHGDKQVSFDAMLRPVKDRTQSQLAFQRPEDRFQIGQQHKRPPKLFGRILLHIGSQYVRSRIRPHGIVFGLGRHLTSTAFFSSSSAITSIS